MLPCGLERPTRGRTACPVPVSRPLDRETRGPAGPHGDRFAAGRPSGSAWRRRRVGRPSGLCDPVMRGLAPARGCQHPCSQQLVESERSITRSALLQSATARPTRPLPSSKGWMHSNHRCPRQAELAGHRRAHRSQIQALAFDGTRAQRLGHPDAGERLGHGGQAQRLRLAHQHAERMPSRGKRPGQHCRVHLELVGPAGGLPDPAGYYRQRQRGRPRRRHEVFASFDEAYCGRIRLIGSSGHLSTPHARSRSNRRYPAARTDRLERRRWHRRRVA